MDTQPPIPWPEHVAMQQIIAETVDRVTRCANNDDPEGDPVPRAELQQFVDARYSAGYEFRVIHLDTGKDTETYTRDQFVEYHCGVHKNVFAVDRLCGAAALVSQTQADGVRTCLFRNMVWSTMFRRNAPETRLINFARMNWIFVRENQEWKLSIWDDAIQFVEL